MAVGDPSEAVPPREAPCTAHPSATGSPPFAALAAQGTDRTGGWVMGRRRGCERGLVGGVNGGVGSGEVMYHRAPDRGGGAPGLCRTEFLARLSCHAGKGQHTILAYHRW